MKKLALCLLCLCVPAAGLASAQSGDVEVVKLCVSTVSLVKETIAAMDLINQDDVASARKKYELALKAHYDDWTTFSLVMGPAATEVVRKNSSMGVVFVSIEDCLSGKSCRADEFKVSAEYIWSQLPLACQSDYRGK